MIIFKTSCNQMFATNVQEEHMIGTITLQNAVYSQFIRLKPLAKISPYNRYSMRFELLGCDGDLDGTSIYSGNGKNNTIIDC